jgi:hypothetical protein
VRCAAERARSERGTATTTSSRNEPIPPAALWTDGRRDRLRHIGRRHLRHRAAVAERRVETGERGLRRLRRPGAAEDGAHRRRPPLAPAVRCRRVARVQVARNLGEALAVCVLFSDAKNELVRNDARAPDGCRLRSTASRQPPLPCEPFELVDGDQPWTPGNVDRLDERRSPPTRTSSTRQPAPSACRPRIRSDARDNSFARSDVPDFTR